MPVAVLITRPEPEALALADTLRARWGCGVKMVISPIMKIIWHEVDLDLSGISTLIFTSRNGVDAFARLTGRRDLPCFAVGPATAEAAREQGMSAVACGGDVESVIDEITRAEPKGRLLHLRGEHAAGNLASRLTAAGFETWEAFLYAQEGCALSGEARALLDRRAPVLLPLYSPRSAALTFCDMPETAPVFAVAISRNAADQVPPGRAESVLVAERPDAQAMLEALDDAYELAIRVEGAKGAQ